MILENLENLSRLDIENHFKSYWNLNTIEDKINFLIGKECILTLKDKTKIKFTCKNCLKNKSTFILLTTDNQEFNCTIRQIKVYYNCPVTFQYVLVFYGRIFKEGWHIGQKILKSLYYKTKEYKEKSSHNGRNSKEAREKAKNTMLERYGVKSFLERGKHYEEKITSVMLKKYGVSVPIKNKDIKQKISNSIKKNMVLKIFSLLIIYFKEVLNLNLKNKF